ncbi:MAG: hypothetical protein MUE82_10835, partial [Chloroflexi bacterium]|nr:hypothetical protein [Chloroflexota bacterium]
VGGAALLLSFGAIASVTTAMLVAIGLVVVGALVLAWAIVPGRRQPTTVAVERDGAEWLNLALAFGGGRLTVEPLTPGGPLVTAWSDHTDIRLGVERSAGEARVRLSRDVAGWDPFGAGTWRVAAAPDLPLALEVQGGAGRFELDLSTARVAGAALYVGAAEVRCRLPMPSGDVRVRIEAGAASIRLELPSGVAYRVRTEGFVTRSGQLERGGYEAARDRLTIEMTGGAASLTVA